MVQSSDTKTQGWIRDAIIILFMLLNTWLILNGKQALDVAVLRVSQAQAVCPAPLAEAAPRIRIGGQITSMSYPSGAKNAEMR